MNKNKIIKALLNGAISFLAVALIQSLVKGMPITQTLVEPYTLILGPCAAIGSYIGYTIRENKKEQL